MANYEEYITNELTGEVALIKSNDYIIFQQKKLEKLETWKKKNSHITSQQQAKEQTQQAQKKIEVYNNILKATLDIDDKINWDILEDKIQFPNYIPQRKPEWQDYKKQLPYRFFLFELITFIKKRNDKKTDLIQKQYDTNLQQYTANEKQLKEKYNQEKILYEKKQSTFNEALISKRKRYENAEKQGLIDYFSLVLEHSKYPESLNPDYKLYAEPNSKLLLIDIDLPKTTDVPRVIEYKYISSSNGITSKEMKEKEFEEFYSNLLYQIVLRTVHEVIESDYQKNIEIVVINGWVDGIDSKTGKAFRNCIMSVQVDRNEFENINLAQIRPEDCFRHLKGVSAGALIKLAPVRPIMKMDTNDKRIIKAENVLDAMNGQTNLAIMDWQEFEILVRDLISKEFAREGCKVEVTQASRDAGVDAIAFDEDPIRGGKYIIQAKRYNNLVPLTAVRDLFGTVHNEGAVKGILITTSYYGRDSLEFVKNKPLKLINGEELLYMFNKHGYHFTIELNNKKAASSRMY